MREKPHAESKFFYTVRAQALRCIKGREGMKKFNGPNKQERASRRHVSSTARALAMRLPLFFLLVLSVAAVILPDASAQSVNTGKNGQGSTPQPDTLASPKGQRDAYGRRFPFAAQAAKADTQHQDPQGGNASDAGTMHAWTAYTPIVRQDLVGTGIAYAQLPMIGTGKPAAARDSELFNNLMTTYGLPMSDSQYQIISRENNQRMMELAFDPERVMWMTSATSQTTTSATSKAMANTGEIALNAVFNRIVNGDGNGSLINVANEGSVAGLTWRGSGDDASVAGAVGMVQTMYKQVFVPMAILFLLPGAVISQVKSIVGKGFNLQAPETQSPFDGILRSIVAVFLIPATQVIMSWSIDTGNSLAYSCRDYVDLPTIMNWTQQLCYDPKKSVNAMVLPNPSGAQGAGGAASGGGLAATGSAIGGAIGGAAGAAIGGFLGGLISQAMGGLMGIGDGLAANQPEAQSVIEQQDWMGQALQSTLNGAMLMAAIMLIVLTALQVVLVCYMLLLGPIAAAFYAWPQVGEGFMFRGVFGRWVEGVIKVSMWRFIWMVILAIMTQRVIYMGGMPTDLRWEVAVFICFLGLMIGVPSSPFTFQPYAAFGSAVQLQNLSMMNSGSAGSGTAPQYAGSPQGQPGQQGAGSAPPGDPGSPGASPTQSNQQTGTGNGSSNPDGTPPAPPPGGDNTTPPPPPPGGSGGSNSPPPPPPPGGDGHHPPPPPPGGGAGASGDGAGAGAGAGAGSGAARGMTAAAGTGASGVASSKDPGSPGGSPPSSGQMPTNGAPVGLTPAAGDAGSTKSNPGASPAAAAAPAAPAGAAGGAGGDGGGDGEGSGEAGSKSATGKTAAAAAGAAPHADASSAIGQIASAAGSLPPPSKEKD
ncbi:MAG: hypothetical protein KGS72_09470 [Cyanobacteria bacterium REEB67]|nr:hypothetical protein [Cyanobacteria bacterium REEB67]